jgi:glycosyltransferase involved in cell wall biosynthesis
MKQEWMHIKQKRMDARAERIRLRKLKEQGVDPLTANTTTPILTTTSTTTSAIIPDDIKLSMEICIHCNFYQKRLTWMLSSLLEQKGSIPHIIINISHTDNDGSPTTSNVCDFFRDKGLNIVETNVTQEEVSNRAIARNRQATNTKADWILFSDSDIVFDPMFFDDLQRKLRKELRDIKLVMGADRHSLNDQFCIKYFSEEDKRIYPCIIENPSEIASKFPVKYKHGKDTCAGYFQLINGNVLRGKCKGKITDNPKDHWRNTRGDRCLRVRAGGRYGIPDTKPIYHLNHDRMGNGIQR